MPGIRYVEAIMLTEPDDPADETVFIPLAEDQDDAPATLVDPLPGYEGGWSRESGRHERPARYLRVD